MSDNLFQIHGYKSGHQLLLENIRLNRMDQDCIDRLSDISGALRPGELFDPYLTCYPLPSTEYFVIGRTWQDLSVQRAGCVITKSLLIPMPDWQSSKNVASLFNIVLKASSDKNVGFQRELDSIIEIPPVHDIPAQELVEALFLENRQPIVVFNVLNTEAILIRLYTAFWSSLRANFSSCTFSLAPRSLSGKPLDLSFAPVSVKSKYSDWNGRRIEANAGNTKLPRRPWTEELAKNIFLSSSPSLVTNSTDSIIKNDNNNDESTLKLNLLWNQLLYKAESESSPLAILGLLDIINAQSVFATELYKNLYPYIFNAVQNATNKLDINDAWKFYAALLVKHRRKQMDRDMLGAVRKQCTVLTESNVEISIDFIENYRHPSNSIPSVLFAAIGDGLAEHFEFVIDLAVTEGLSVDIFLSLISSSKKLAQKIALNFDQRNYSLSRFISEALGSYKQKLVIKAKKNISTFISESYQTELLIHVFDNIDLQLYRLFISNIGRNTSFAIREFDAIIFESTERFYQYEFLKETIDQFDKSGAGDSLLIAVIRKDPTNLRWLVSHESIVIIRKVNILKGLLQQLTKNIVEVISNDSKLSANLVEILSEDISDDLQIATLVCYANIPVPKAINILINLPKNIIKQIDDTLMTRFLMNVFSEDEIDFALIQTLLHRLDNKVFVALLNEWVTDKYPSKAVLTGVKSILLSGEKVSYFLSIEILWISKFLANTLGGVIDHNLVVEWAYLLRSAKSQKQQYHEAAGVMMNFAYQSKIADPTDLISASFPIVYKTFLHDNPLGQILPFLFFSDWDKCKTLRHDLVNRYLRSSWPAFGLLEVAFEANILKDIVAILNDSSNGKIFLAEAIGEIQSNKIRHPLVKDLKRYIKK